MARRKKRSAADWADEQVYGSSDSGGARATTASEWAAVATKTSPDHAKSTWKWNDKTKEELSREVASKEAEKEAERKKIEEQAKQKAEADRQPNIWDKVNDVFTADSTEDKRKRVERGEPELFKDQRSALKEKTDKFKHESKDEFQRGEAFNFAKPEIDERRDHYARNGIDIDQATNDKIAYEKFREQNKGKSLARLTLDNAIPEEVKRYNDQQKQIAKVEKMFQEKKRTESGADNTLQQLERAVSRGLVQPIAEAPYSVANLAGGALDAASYEGTPADRLAERMAGFGKEGRETVKQKIDDAGLGQSEHDNSFVANVGSGIGSLGASIATAGVVNPGTAGVLFGVNAGADQQIAAEEAGKSENQSFLTGIVSGTAEAALEKIGLEKYLGASGGVVKKTIIRAVTEGTQEATQSAAQLIGQATYDEVKLGDAIVQVLTEWGYGAFVGGGSGMVMSLAENLEADGMPPEEAEVIANQVAQKVTQVVNEEMPVPKDGEVQAPVDPGVPDPNQVPTDPGLGPQAGLEPPIDMPVEGEVPGGIPPQESITPPTDIQPENPELAKKLVTEAPVGQPTPEVPKGSMKRTSKKPPFDPDNSRPEDPNYPTAEPAQPSGGELTVKDGDYIVNDAGDVMVVTSGNDKYLGDSLVDKNNHGFLRAAYVGGNKGDIVGYANQIRLATDEEIAKAKAYTRPDKGRMKLSKKEQREKEAEALRIRVEKNEPARKAAQDNLDTIATKVRTIEKERGLEVSQPTGTVAQLTEKYTKRLEELSKPTKQKVYRGHGGKKDVITEHGVSIFGNDVKYYATDAETAKKFGENIEEAEISIDNPLTITNDAQWRELSTAAGNKYPNPKGYDKAETEKWVANTRKHIESQGYDGVIVKLSGSESDSKLITRVFGSDQVVSFKEKVEAPSQKEVEKKEKKPAPQVGKTVEAPAPPINNTVKLTYPDSQDLPQSVRDLLPSGQSVYEPMVTVAGNIIQLTSDDIAKSKAPAILLAQAMKEAKARKDQDSIVRIKKLQMALKQEETWPAEESLWLNKILFGIDGKMQLGSPKDAPLDTSKLTKKELGEILDDTMVWGRTQVREFINTVPGLKDYPVFLIKKQGSDYYATYSSKDPKTGATFTGQVNLKALGLETKRLEAAGLQDGMKLDMREAVSKGSNKIPAIQKSGVNYSIEEKSTTKSMKREKWSGSKTPEQLQKFIADLNKAGQKNALSRRGRLKSKKAAGMFTHYPNTPRNANKQGDESIKLRDDVIMDSANYVTTLSHELAHAIEWVVTGYTGKHTIEMLGGVDAESKGKIRQELKAIVDHIESKAVVDQNPDYYYKATEMWARYIELWLMENTNARELAPTVTKGFEALIIKEQAVKDLYNALEGNIDKGHVSHTPPPLKDRKQLYQHHLGKEAGQAAWDAEVIRRAEAQRAAQQISKLVKEKFKGVKDSGEALFRAAEAIKLVDGETVYGTTDYYKFRQDQEEKIKEFIEDGFEPVNIEVDKDGNQLIVLARVRYTEEQAREILESLTPEGRQLVEDFNTARKDAKDMFNRDLLKEIYKINSKLEGWVHHTFKNKGNVSLGRSQALKQKKAGSQKFRGGKEGYMLDFRKAMEKAMVDLATAKIDNAFVQRQLARVSKPLAKGQQPDPGWTAMIYDKRHGLRLPGESRDSMVILDYADSSELEEALGLDTKEIEGAHLILKEVQHYQIPSELAEHYRNIRHIPQEISKMVKVLDFIGKFWTINVLTHPGTTDTNFVSGGLQYSLKIFSDFYLEVLTGSIKFEKTRGNISAPIMALLPGGWTKAPDWMWGGYRSTLYGQLASETVDGKLDKYGNLMLRAFGMVENYWKRVIALSEGANMGKEKLGRELRELDRMEKAMIAEINKATGLYGLDYDDTPLWMARFDRKGGKLVKPFITYPYKYTKMLAHHAVAPFDHSLTWQERTSKGLALGTIMFLVAAYMDDRDEKKKTPEGTVDTPHQLRPGGRIFSGVDDKGRELFLRTAKYPFFNVSSIGRSMLQGHFDQVSDILREQYGTIGIGADIALLAIGRKSEFDQYKPNAAILGEKATTFIPGFRIWGDVSKVVDPNARKTKTFMQGLMSVVPVWGDEATLEKWRGEKRTIDIPDEPEEGRSMSNTSKSSTTRDIVYERADVLRSMIAGIYLSRIDPVEARKQELREQRNSAEKEIRDILAKDPESQEARDKAQKAGFILSEKTIDYYRNKQ